TSHVPGDGGDDPALAWNLWWVKHALIDLGINPFDCRYMFYPIGINLAFYTLTVLNGVLSIPLQAIWGVIPAGNLLLLFSFALSAFGTYLLALEPLRRRPGGFPARTALAGAFFAGLIYGFSSSKLFYASLGQFNIASSQWIPFYVLMLARMTRYPRAQRYPVLAGLFLVLQAWAEMTFAAFLVVFTALYGLWVIVESLLSRRTASPAGEMALRPADWWPWIRGLAVIGVLFVLGIAPMLTAMLPDMRAEGDFFVVGSGFAETFSSDLLGFFIPTQLHPWFGGWVDGFRFPHDKAQHYYLGYSVLAMAIAGLAAGRRRAGIRFWGLSALVFLILALGPSLRIDGVATGVPLPFRIFQELPFFKGNRYPSRFGVLMVLSLAVLAGWGMAWVWQMASRRRLFLAPAVASAVVALFIVEHISTPLPLSDLRLPRAYAALIEDVGEAARGSHPPALLDLPIAWRNGFRITGIMHPIFMYAQFYQTSHHLPLLGGNTSRNPEHKFQYFTDAPVLNSLIALEGGHALSAEAIARDRQIAPEVFRFLNIRYIMVHKPTAGTPMEEYVETVFPAEMIYEDSLYRLYRVVPALPAPAAVVYPHTGIGRLMLGEGWGQPNAGGSVWMESPQARLLAPLPSGAVSLSLEMRAPISQPLTIFLNDCRLGQGAVGPAWQELTVEAPAACVRPGANDILLRAVTPIPVNGSLAAAESRTVGRTGVISPVSITVRSAGKEVGDFGHIYIDGRDISPNRRGYNLVAVDPSAGAVLAAGAFDTHLDPSASERMVRFIEELPQGAIVAVAVMDEASMNLSEPAVQALEALGLAGSVRGRFRWSHAAVGVKGAPPASAAEALSEIWPAAVTVGGGFTRPQAYVELRALSWQARQ
ncbi:MAG: interleukin-like EMT inducer domain-containing protein, partial [Anaerolineae bacterium]